MMFRSACAVFLLLLAGGCEEGAEVSAPPPARMTAEALGHYCQMILMEHEGPKAQVHLVGQQHPLWFSQVRDAIAFLRLPEETAEVSAIYVSDMGQAESWADPGTENWTAARQAYYVIGSGKRGGMGAPEAVPFDSADAADAFTVEHGGKVVRMAQIPDDYVLAPLDVSEMTPDQSGGH